MGRAQRAEHALEIAAAIRAAMPAVHDPHAARQLRRAERLVLRDAKPSVPKHRAAAVLGISVTALQRWIDAGRLPAVRRRGGREEVDCGPLLDVVEEVRRIRAEDGSPRRALAHAFRRLAARGLPRRRGRPNRPAAELRQDYIASTPVTRLRDAAELSLAATTLARYGAASRARDRDG
jgi:hypothetical protein